METHFLSHIPPTTYSPAAVTGRLRSLDLRRSKPQLGGCRASERKQRTQDGQRRRAMFTSSLHLRLPRNAKRWAALLFSAPSRQHTPPTHGTRPSGVRGDPKFPSPPCRSPSGLRLEKGHKAASRMSALTPSTGAAPSLPWRQPRGREWDGHWPSLPARSLNLIVNQKTARNPHTGQMLQSIGTEFFKMEDYFVWVYESNLY